MLELANGVPPLAPVLVACLPLVSMEFKMFSTDSAVRELVLCQVFEKQPFEMLAGFQLSHMPAGKSFSEEQLRHASRKFVPLLVLISGKLVSEEQLSHALIKLAPLLVSSKGKLVSEEQLRHALKKLVPLLVLISGKLVSEEQFCHAAEKLVPLLVSSNGKLVSEEQLNHAAKKFVTPAKFFTAPPWTNAALAIAISFSDSVRPHKPSPTSVSIEVRW